MIIGAMNHPQRDIIEEIKWMAEMGLDFIDLTLEPPAAASWNVDGKTIRRAIEDHNLAVIGHSAFYLPMAHPMEEVRRGAVDELRRCLDIFSEVGAPWMNLHPDRHAPMHDWNFVIERNLQSLHDLLPHARACGVGLMLENLPDGFNAPHQLAPMLDALPEIGLHLDIGHANLMTHENTTGPLCQQYGDRLKHVHLHDNKGGHADLHLPLGSGTLDIIGSLRAVKNTGFDGTITLEVFTADTHYLRYSRDVLRRIWDEIP